MIRVAFLFDPTNCWIAQHLPKYIGDSTKFEFHEIYDERKVRDFDIVFVLGYTKILKGEILQSNNLLLVVHESDLPRGRGFSPMQWQVLEGVKNITVCLLEVSDEVDTGDIYDKMILSLDGSELYRELRSKQAEVTFQLIKRFLSNYPNYNVLQQVGEPTFYRRRSPYASKLNADETIRDQFNLLRVCNNKDWPAFFELEGVTYTLKIEKYD